MARTFREKLADDQDFPRVEPLAGGMRRRYGPGTILIPRARDVDALMRQVRQGRLTTVNHLRAELAARHHATIACPIVTGIHARIAAGAAGEAEAEGKRRVTPFWRTLKEGGEINPKYPGGVAGQRKRLALEGHRFRQRGARVFVADFERRLAPIGR